MLRIAAVLMLFSLPLATLAGEKDGRLDVYWIDVEGGAATLIVTPAGESVLIDTGNPGVRDAGRISKVAANMAGLKKIDHLIITHYHRDHYGGAATLSSMMPIGVVHDNGKFEDMPDNPGKAYFEFKADNRQVINPGDKIPLKQAEGSPTLKFTCLGARKQFIKPPPGATENKVACEAAIPKDRDGSDNANSVVMLLDFGPFRFYDGGDLTWNQEVKLVCPYNLIGEVDVYQVTHHGLASSNNPVVLQTVKPRVAIMNNGVTKGCLPEVFANLKGTSSIEAIYQGHKNMRADGAVNNVEAEYIANTATENCPGNIIKMSVAPDGKSYTVSIPSNDHERMFETKAK